MFFCLYCTVINYDLLQDIRTKMREMGGLSGVPIEPKEQTALLDACVSQAGVIAGGVPGGEISLLPRFYRTLTCAIYSGWL